MGRGAGGELMGKGQGVSSWGEGVLAHGERGC